MKLPLVTGIIILCLAGALRGAPVAPPELPALGVHARQVLHEIMDSEQGWVRIHAAEALVAAGDGAEIRTKFLRELPQFETSPIRVGYWRVLTRTAPSPAERAPWIARIEHTYLDPTASDHPQSIETLDKLGCRLDGPALALARREAAGPAAGLKVLALWSAQLAGEPGALEKLTSLLASPDLSVRTSVGYALRWLDLSDPAMRRALARAVEHEPADSRAYPFLLGAAVTTGADPAQAAAWLAKLNQVLATGSTDARFEASWTLQSRTPAADLPRLAPLLDLPAKENDTRIGAAMIILTTLARE